MAKHIIEEHALRGAGFSVATTDGVDILSEHTDQVLTFETDGTIDIDIRENKLQFSARTPVFKTIDW